METRSIEQRYCWDCVGVNRVLPVRVVLTEPLIQTDAAITRATGWATRQPMRGLSSDHHGLLRRPRASALQSR